MAHTSLLHWIGVTFILASAILLLVTSISAPAVNDIAILKIKLTNKTNIRHSSVSFGSFGYCILDVPPIQTDQDYCPKHHLGYKPAVVMANVDQTDLSWASRHTVDGLTHALVLHPIACAIAFFAFLVSCGAGMPSSLLGALIAAIAWILTLVVMIIDFVIFGAVKYHVNNDGSGSHAYYSAGMWCALAAMILLFLGMSIDLFTCFSGRKQEERRYSNTQSLAHNTEGEVNPTYGRKKRFGVF